MCCVDSCMFCVDLFKHVFVLIHAFRGHFKPKMARRIIDLTCYSEEVSIPETLQASEQNCTRVANEEIAVANEEVAIPVRVLPMKKLQASKQNCTRVANEEVAIPVKKEEVAIPEGVAIPEEVANEQDCTHVAKRAKRDEPVLQENALYFIVGSSQSFHLQSLDLAHL